MPTLKKNSISYLKELEKEKHPKPKVGRRKEIIKVRIEKETRKIIIPT